MKAIILDLTSASGPDTNLLSTSISFNKFIDFVKETAMAESSLRREYLQKAVALLSVQPGISAISTIEQATEFADQLNIVSQLLTPTLQQQEKMLWAIGMPLSPVMFYGTDSFYEMIMAEKSGQLRSEVINSESVTISQRDKVLPMYELILLRLYNITTPAYKPMVITIKGQVSNMPKYFRINIDHRFTDVYPAGNLPEINVDAVQQLLSGDGDFGQLLSLLPPELFRFEGISIITLTDVTAEYALEHIQSTVLEMHQLDSNIFYGRITDSLRVLVGNPQIDFGMIPLLRVNHKLVFDQKTIFHSKLVAMDLGEDYLTAMYLLLTEHFQRNPGMTFTPPAFHAEERLNNFVNKIQSAGIHYYAVLPVYNGPQLVGLLELYSTEQVKLGETSLSQLNLAKHLISNVFQNVVHAFDYDIETVIKEKFTSIQNAVQWKFREAAWLLLRNSSSNPLATIGKIGFENVYPLYGAVDIRNSTSIRNECLRQDLKIQFGLIINILVEIRLRMGLFLADEMKYKCETISAEVSDETKNLDEMRVVEFLESEVHPFLDHFLEVAQQNSESDKINQIQQHDQIVLTIRDYFKSIDPEEGTAYANRRDLEKSMKMINSTVNNALDNFKTQVQPLYPAYFEKFRTDGVEYDIYIGQSIDPEKAFNFLYLKNVMLWQVSSMASISKLTHELLAVMKIPLQTTQLIFVNSNAIDISFRDDERRFDVEGSYNIRYQVVKKRIDKACIRDTGERLTQPGKIALVYFQNKSVNDYLNYIRFLQAQNILSQDLEFLELEELQGVSGLKALRVGVNLSKI